MPKQVIPQISKEPINEMLSAIDICLKSEFFIPSLILIYSCIDIMAWLNRKKSHKDVKASDFIRWVEKYLLPDSGLNCKAIDLYAARCSLLHSYTAESKLSRTAESKLSRKGDVNKIFYAWGKERAKELEYVFDRIVNERIYIIEVHDFFDELKNAIEKFLEFILKDPELIKIIEFRAQKFFRKRRPAELAKDLLKRFKEPK